MRADRIGLSRVTRAERGEWLGWGAREMRSGRSEMAFGGVAARMTVAAAWRGSGTPPRVWKGEEERGLLAGDASEELVKQTEQSRGNNRGVWWWWLVRTKKRN